MVCLSLNSIPHLRIQQPRQHLPRQQQMMNWYENFQEMWFLFTYFFLFLQISFSLHIHKKTSLFINFQIYLSHNIRVLCCRHILIKSDDMDITLLWYYHVNSLKEIFSQTYYLNSYENLNHITNICVYKIKF